MLFYSIQVFIINITDLPLHYLSRIINYLMFNHVVVNHLNRHKKLSINNHIGVSQLDS